ncbi:MAG: diguanylate cyclase [Methylococcales bacterium]
MNINIVSYKIPLLAALLAIIGGVVVLLGWTLDNNSLKGILPFWLPIKANAAVCFVLLGSAIILSDYLPLALNANTTRICLYVGQACAILAGSISLLTLSEYAFNVNLGIDELLFRDPVDNAMIAANPMTLQLETTFSGRIKLEAATCFLLLAIASIHSDKNSWRIISASFGVIILALSLASLSSILTPSLGQFGWFGYGVMRMNAAVLFALLGAAEVVISWRRNVLSWSLSKSITLVFIMGLFLLILIGFNSSRAQFWLQSTHNDIVFHENRETELDSLLVSVSKAQTNTRGYVITRNEQFLTAFLSAKTDSFIKLNALKQIENSHFMEIDAQVNALFQWYQQVIDSRKISVPDTNDMILHGTDLLDRLTQLLLQLKNEDEQHLIELKQSSERVTRFFYRIISIGTLLSVIVFLGVIFRYNFTESHRKQAEITLRDSERQLQLVLEGGRLGFWDWNILTNEVQRNVRWAEMLGYSYEEIQHTTQQWADFVHPDDREKAWQSIYDVLEGKKSYHELEYRMLHKDGSICWILDHANIVQHDENGKPSRMSGTHSDITERKKIEKTHTFLSQIVHQYTDENFFITLARYLAQCLDMSFVCIDYLKSDYLTAKTLAVYHDGLFEDNVEYALKDTPCGNVVGNDICCFPAHVCQLFPKDEVLKTLNAESYIGITLWSGTGLPIGLIALIDNKPLANPELAKSILKIIAGRAAGELERLQADIELRIAATVFESQESMLIADANSVIIKVNHAFTKMTGYSEAEVLGKNPRLFNSGRHDKAFYTALWQSLKDTGTWQGEIWNKRKNGEIYPEWMTITVVKANKNQQITHYVKTATDITLRKAAEEEIKQLAFYDPLTGLPNRRKLLDRLRYAITINHRTNTKFVVFMMDLDKFKAVNDSLGHAAGDELLKQVAHRMTGCLRDSDMVARLGGDEFVLVLENLKIPHDAEIVALKLITDLTMPFHLSKNHCVQISATIGISIYPQHGSTPEILMDRADTALYQAKDDGRGCFAYFADYPSHA